MRSWSNFVEVRHILLGFSHVGIGGLLVAFWCFWFRLLDIRICVFFFVGGIHTCWKYRVHIYVGFGEIIYVGFGEIIDMLPTWNFKWIFCVAVVLCVGGCIVNEMSLTRPLFFTPLMLVIFVMMYFYKIIDLLKCDHD